MADPGLPPRGRPRSLHLLESLVQEEEAKLQKKAESDVVIPTETRESTESGSPDFYDIDKQQIKSGGSPSASYSEFKMKETDNSTKMAKGNPNAGFRGKKIKKQSSRSRSTSRDRVQTKSKKVARPFSADYNKYKRNQLNSNVQNGRPKTSKGRIRNNRTSSPKGQRPRSPDSYSSRTYSSDEEYIKKKKYRSDSDHSLERKETSDRDSFFDSEIGTNKNKTNVGNNSPRDRSRSRSSDSNSSYSSRERSNRRRSRSRSNSPESDHGRSSNQKSRKSRRNYRSSSSSSSSSDQSVSRNKNRHRNSRSRSASSESSDGGENSPDRRVNGHSEKKVNVKTVYANKHGHQGTGTSNGQRMVVVEDCSSSESDSERKKPVKKGSKPPLHLPKKTKPLLSRKKREGYKIFQIDPDMYLEGKLQQKYSELEELMTCSFVDQKSHMTRHHLYQMELLRDQYQNVSHGLPSAATIIPRSLPGEIRNRRPVSAKMAPRRPHYGSHSDLESNSTYTGKSQLEGKEQPKKVDQAYGTLRSVMGAERARQEDKIRTDILVERPASAKRSTKKKKKLDSSLRSKKSDTEEDTSERPSFSSISKASSSPRTPRNGPSIDDHIKYSENEKLRKWLKEKDKIYRQQAKEERKKKREEREQMVKEANEKFMKKLESQKYVKKWMKSKSKEWVKIQKDKRQKEKEEDEWLESYKKTKSVPGDTLRIRPQSAPSTRSDDKDESKLTKEEIHAKREKEEEARQAKKAQQGPHPPQTKFIYKRPVAGKIKLNMQVRGKSPVAPKSDSEDKDEVSEKEKAKQMRMSYDDWVKMKREHDATRKENAKRQRQLAKSDPELERIIPELGRKRIEDKLNSRKRIDTGMKKFDNKTNRSFGGGDFDGEPIERPRSAYRLAADLETDDGPALTVKQLNRPSTAPAAGRRKVPSPKKSVNSPRKAIIPQRADRIMSNEDTPNPYTLPFPPDKGIPAHVAERQRRIFANQVTHNLNEIEQRALLNAELIKEGVSEADIAEFAEKSRAEIDNPVTKISIDVEEEAKIDEHPNINEIMYSPKKRDSSSESSSDENEKIEEKSEESAKNAKIPEDSEEKKDEVAEPSVAETETANEIEERNENEKPAEDNSESSDGHRHYKTYENLNELNLESQNTEAKLEENEDHLREEIEQLRERVDHLQGHVQPEIHLHHENETKKDTEPTITVISDPDPNVVGILKETKKSEDIPKPEMSEEPELSATNTKNDDDDENEKPSSPREGLSNSRKRVSFNEQTEVFQSFESTSTETVTPETEDFDPSAESLDNQRGFDDGDDDDDNDDRPAILKLQGDKMTINIGGMVLNPTVIEPPLLADSADNNDDDDYNDDNDDTANNENNDEIKSTFLTNPDEESNA